ncbi:hypothetical protein N7507_004372 [Penicillium longicatenatum]|nr:hypothetical protein N7507_004372 [Penicillium longicatenatum]
MVRFSHIVAIIASLATRTYALPSFTQPVANYKWPTQFVRSAQANLQVIMQGSGPTVVIIPSYGRDGSDDFDYFSSALAAAGFLVLRSQPRGTFESTGPMTNVTLEDLAADIISVIDTLGGGEAIVIGHAFGTFLTKVIVLYPEKVSSIVVAAPGGINLPTSVGNMPFIGGNTSLPLAERLDALKTAFFAPNHDAHLWLDGWYTDVLVIEHGAVEAYRSLTSQWGGGNDTQVLEIIPADDPFQPKSEWNATTSLYPDRAPSVVIQDASHALFPEQGRSVVDAVLPWLKLQSAKLR